MSKKLNFFMNNKILAKFSEISQISIFSGINRQKLLAILAYAKISDYKKDDTLFLQSEKKEKFFIVLNGLVKLAITDQEGKEVIMKISDFGMIDDILEGDHSFSCKALEASEILVLPLEKFTYFVKEDEILVNNILFETLKQNKELNQQLASLKLGNGKNKVGQFLLKNSFKDGNKLKNLELNYNKSQIASYLGIRLETFSRLLHQLEEEGEISINKNKISLNNQESLCKYCNNEIAKDCKSSEQDFCKN